MTKKIIASILLSFLILSQSITCFAYTNNYSQYRAAKESEYNRYQQEKERSYQQNRGKSYSERRKDYNNIYKKHSANNDRIYKQYH